MKTKIKFINPFNDNFFKTIYKKRAILAAILFVAAGVMLTTGVWQTKVSGQELFSMPPLEVLPPVNPILLPDMSIKKADMDIAYLSAEKDSQLNDKFDRLIAKADAEGSVPVIVGFRFDFTLDGNLTDSRIADQRAEIKQEQNAVLRKIENSATKNIKQFKTIPYFAVTVDGATLRYLKSLPEITSISEDGLSAPTLNQSVPLVGAPTAWAAGSTGNGWKIAVLDTGVDSNHPFLSGKVFSEACYSTTNSAENSTSVCPGGVAQSTAAGSGINCNTAISDCDHGTHVAGIAAGDEFNIHGVAKWADLISIQVFSKIDYQNGSVAESWDSDQILGLERVMTLRTSFAIAAVNMSLGSGGHSSTCDGNAAYTTAITNLRSVDIATVISSGNDSNPTGISFPACISTAVSVGSTGDGSGGATVDQVSSFSNSASILKLLAPGQLINSSVPGGAYANKSGTSMAAPHVAGAWAILKQRVPNASVDSVLNALTSTGLQVTDTRSGANNRVKPRIRIDGALRVLSGGTCGYSITPSSASRSRSAGSGSFSVNATESDCGWTATSNNSSWLTVTSGASGTGDGIITYSVTANTTAFLRTGTISVGGQTFTVTQQGDCVFGVSPTSRSVGYGGDSGSYLTVSATSGCTWTASESFSWISITGTASGNGNGGITYSVAANGTGADRTGTINVNGKIFTITQSGNFTNCQSFAPIALNQTINGALTTSDCVIGGSTSYVDQYSFNGTAGQRIAITMHASFGPKLYLVDPNGDFTTTNYGSRIPADSGFLTLPVSGTYKIFATSFFNGFTGSYSLTLNDEATCGNSSISPTSQQFPNAAGSGAINLTINGGCAWSAGFIFNGWLTITSGSRGIGSGTINYTVAANSTGASRTETIIVNGMPFIITQSAQPTAASVSISGRVLNSGGTGRGISGATLYLTDASGDTRTARTNSFGYYHFVDVPAGETYIVDVRHKRYQFAPQVVSVVEDLTELNFVALQGQNEIAHSPERVFEYEAEISALLDTLSFEF